MVDRSVLVSGGGIAGSTAAYWLEKAGWSVTIVERAADTRSSGNPVDVRGAAVAIARQMGIWSRLEEAATGVERLVFVDADGRPQATIRTRRRVDRHEEVEVARSDLVGLLFDRAREASLIIRDDSISALHQDVGGIDVEFQRAPSRRFDLVVGADGLGVRPRGTSFPPFRHVRGHRARPCAGRGSAHRAVVQRTGNLLDHASGGWEARRRSAPPGMFCDRVAHDRGNHAQLHFRQDPLPAISVPGVAGCLALTTQA
jgi:2-polyprenyl-6-methoxyphenol hydroxylase-like FAD-dependent oxidoreductase